MALSYFTVSEAPRDFRISSTDSEGHYAKCLLCCQLKMNFYCVDCIRNGNFVHSSMPYSDRFAEKQLKLHRMKTNRKHVLDRCERIIANKLRRDVVLAEVKLSKDKIELLKLAIEQRKHSMEEEKKVLVGLKQKNIDISLILPRYQKKVALLAKHAQDQRIVLQNTIGTYTDKAQNLEALRRSRIRQLTKYIFPVYMSYDTSDSIEDLEFLGDIPEEQPKRLHIVAPWINTDGDFSDIATLSSGGGSGGWEEAHRTSAALGLAAQLSALLAWTMDGRLPNALPLPDYYAWRGGPASARAARRLCACGAALAARAQLAPPPPPAARAMAALHAIAVAAATDDPLLGRVDSWVSESVCAASAEWSLSCADNDNDDNDPPEHISWPDATHPDDADPPAPLSAPLAAPLVAPPSLVNSAVASIAAVWRGWTK